MQTGLVRLSSTAADNLVTLVTSYKLLVSPTGWVDGGPVESNAEKNALGYFYWLVAGQRIQLGDGVKQPQPTVIWLD